MKRDESELGVVRFFSDNELSAYREMVRLYKCSPIPDREVLANLGLFLNRSALSRIITFCELYQKILNVHGHIIEFGARWGQTLSLFCMLRNIYEPYNFSRKIIGFDTFEGSSEISPLDGSQLQAGGFSVTEGYERYLEQILTCQEALSPRGHLKRFELVKGDVRETLPQYLTDHPETILAFVYFDMVIYEPTKESLRLIRDRLTKGSVVGFDELTLSEFPGETTAFIEEMGLQNCRLQRNPASGCASFIVIE
jgi:hypothetical protein